VSFTVPKMVAVEVCATLRQVPNAINTTRAVANFPTTCRLGKGCALDIPA